MKCKVCGANNEDYLEYCEKCAAPLTPDEPEPAPDIDGKVFFTSENPLEIGDYVEIEISDTLDYDLMGEVVSQ